MLKLTLTPTAIRKGNTRNSDSDSLKASSESPASADDDAYSLVSSYDAEIAYKHESNESVKQAKLNRFAKPNVVAVKTRATASFGELG